LLELVFNSHFTYLPPTSIYTLSLHDALPIYDRHGLLTQRAPLRSRRLRHGGDQRLLGRTGQLLHHRRGNSGRAQYGGGTGTARQDRKSTRLNSSHVKISYAVFCLKKKTIKIS